MSPVPHSVKFSWFRSEFTVLKVEIEDRNLVTSPSSENSWIRWGKYRFSLQLCASTMYQLRFNYVPECMVSSMHFSKFSGEGSPSVSTDFYPRSISGCVFDLGFALNSRALASSIGSGFALNSPLQHVY